MKYNINHTQYFNDNNEEVPSATTILKILNKPSLVQWANSLGFKHQKVNDVLDDYSTIGTLVHEIINIILRDGDYVYIKTNDRPPLDLVKGHIDSFYAWYYTNKIESILLEKSFSTTNFGGTVDFYGKVNMKYTIIDFKTSKKFYLSMFLQLALYCILMESKGFQVEQVGIVLCNPTIKATKYIQREDLVEYTGIAQLLIELFHNYYNLNIKNDWKEKLI